MLVESDLGDWSPQLLGDSDALDGVSVRLDEVKW
jgi:hypothetical protein